MASLHHLSWATPCCTHFEPPSAPPRTPAARGSIQVFPHAPCSSQAPYYRRLVSESPPPHLESALAGSPSPRPASSFSRPCRGRLGRGLALSCCGTPSAPITPRVVAPPSLLLLMTREPPAAPPTDPPCPSRRETPLHRGCLRASPLLPPPRTRSQRSSCHGRLDLATNRSHGPHRAGNSLPGLPLLPRIRAGLTLAARPHPAAFACSPFLATAVVVVSPANHRRAMAALSSLRPPRCGRFGLAHLVSTLLAHHVGCVTQLHSAPNTVPMARRTSQTLVREEGRNNHYGLSCL
ncbi:hypothetical protein ZWY2020_021286 [Hordeum vulgare]|nr:hypothetical protein ZWY2020_021286 [Hordeum vulgare]